MPYYIQEMCLSGITHHMPGTQHGPEGMTSTGRDHTMTASCILSVQLNLSYMRQFWQFSQILNAVTIFSEHEDLCSVLWLLSRIFSALVTDRKQQWRHFRVSWAYPSSFGLCVGILLSCVSFEAVRGCKCDFLFVCNQNKIQLFDLFKWMLRATKRTELIKRITLCSVSGIDEYFLDSPKCRKTFPSFLSMLSWSLVRRSWYCCCLIFATTYSASCERKVHRNVTQPTDSEHALSCFMLTELQHWQDTFLCIKLHPFKLTVDRKSTR